MKNIIKYGVVGLVGYIIGFYEMKYKVIKLMLKSQIEKDTKSNEEEEAQ